MSSTKSADKALARFFRVRRVARIDELSELLGVDSRVTVFRRLRKIGYHTSVTHTGRYYTLREIPEFDEHGLWFFQGIGFSRAGSLRDTIVTLVEEAEAGATHEELRDRLRVRVQNALLALVNANRISRHALPGEYLYLSAGRERAAHQLTTRQGMQPSGAVAPPLPKPVIISILLEVIHFADVQIDPTGIARRLRNKGIDVSEEQVEQTLDRFGIAKKRAL